MLTSFQRKCRTIKYSSNLPIENMICEHDVLWTRIEYRVVRPKKKVVFLPEIFWAETFYHSPARTVKFVSEYIYLMSKNKQAKKTKEKNKNTIKAKNIKKI